VAKIADPNLYRILMRKSFGKRQLE